MSQWWIIAKTFVKSSLDNYISPGTLTGTEILLVYLAQWRRDLALVTSASLYLLAAELERSACESVLMRARNERRNVEDNSR